MRQRILVLAIFSIISLILLSGCAEQSSNNNTQARPYLQIYKSKADYTNQMSIILDENFNVGLYPALPNPTEVKEKDGYYYAHGPKISLNYLVVLDLTIEEWENMEGKYSANDFKEMILEMHPLEEAYFCDLDLGLKPVTQQDEEAIIQSISAGEIPIECEEIKFTSRLGERE